MTTTQPSPRSPATEPEPTPEPKPARAPLIVVDGIDHAYADVEVLADVSLSVGPGESLALLGPSGCGKTTLLRTIAGLERPSAGNICIGDDHVFGPDVWVAPERRRVGIVFQDWALFPHLPVAKNVGYGLRGDKTAAIEHGLALVGLAGLGQRMPMTLSGGQQQRVALARALAPRPRVLLLDEPFSNLDTTMRVEVRSEIRRLLLDLGITAIFVTHDQEEAFVVGDRVAVMQAGRIVQVDTPRDLYTRPANRWLAGFVGDASFISGSASGRSAVTDIGRLPLHQNMQGPVDVLLRPEQLVLTDGDSATVEDVEFYGHDAMVVVTLADRTLRVRTGPEVTPARGDGVGIEFRGGSTSAFPIGTPPKNC